MDAAAPVPSLRVLTINTHKGFTALNRRFVLPELRDAIRAVGADLVFLQEVQGEHEHHAARHEHWPRAPHYEFLADSLWPQFAYGRNSVYPHGHHGNALLSRWPIVVQSNEAISAHAFETRGLLHAGVSLRPRMPELHCINVHLGLLERGRQWQVRAMCERIRSEVPRNAPLIVAGDFNDWRHHANRQLVDQLAVTEVFEAVKGRPARTFPSVLPLFRLDRIYSRGLDVIDARVHYAYPGRRLSDHAALAATFELASRRRP